MNIQTLHFFTLNSRIFFWVHTIVIYFIVIIWLRSLWRIGIKWYSIEVCWMKMNIKCSRLHELLLQISTSRCYLSLLWNSTVFVLPLLTHTLLCIILNFINSLGQSQMSFTFDSPVIITILQRVCPLCQAAWVQGPSPPLISYMTLSKQFAILYLSFLIYRLRTVMASVTPGCHQNWNELDS